MKKTTSIKMFFSILMILGISLSGLSKTEIIVSQWLSSPLNIDGTSVDWEDDVQNFEKKVGVNYAFKNDGETLFVLFVLKDPKYLSSIKATGMTIWFNTEGKKKKSFGITFMKREVPADAYLSYLEQQRGPIPEEKKKEILANRSYFFHETLVTNKKSKSSSQPSDSGEAKPAIFRSDNQNKMLIYEFAIPLKRVTENAPGIGTEPGKIIKVGFQWGGMTEEMRKRMLQRQIASGGRSTGAADYSAWDNEQGSNRRGSSVPRQAQTAKTHSFWVDVQLAQNN